MYWICGQSSNKCTSQASRLSCITYNTCWFNETIGHVWWRIQEEERNCRCHCSSWSSLKVDVCVIKIWMDTRMVLICLFVIVWSYFASVFIFGVLYLFLTLSRNKIIAVCLLLFHCVVWKLVMLVLKSDNCFSCLFTFVLVFFNWPNFVCCVTAFYLILIIFQIGFALRDRISSILFRAVSLAKILCLKERRNCREEMSEKNYFDLPIELRVKILANITDEKEKLSLRLLSKTVRNDVDDARSWKNINVEISVCHFFHLHHLCILQLPKRLKNRVIKINNHSVLNGDVDSRVLTYYLPRLVYAKGLSIVNHNVTKQGRTFIVQQSQLTNCFVGILGLPFILDALNKLHFACLRKVL
jgi:hypothetical protein